MLDYPIVYCVDDGYTRYVLWTIADEEQDYKNSAMMTLVGETLTFRQCV